MNLPQKFPDDETLKREGVKLLGDLIRFDTTNPPGNESACAEYLGKWYESRGITGRVVESAPGRGSYIGRIKGAGPSLGALLMLSHLDVVPAVASEWTVPPFSGELKDGYVWGRGALDCKGPVVMQALALAGLVEAGVKFRRDIVIGATADEEMGGEKGVLWLLENRKDDLFAPFALNEGGGFGINARGKTWYTCQTSEKKICWINLRARGDSGHASMPFEGSAMNNMAKALAEISTHRAPINRESRHAVEAMWRLIAGWPGAIAARLATYPIIGDFLIALISDNVVRRMVKAMFTNTISITVVHGGDKANVIPSQVDATLDCRLLPGMSHEEMLEDIRRVAGKYGVTAELSTTSNGAYTEPDSDLFHAIEAAVTSLGPDHRVAPFMSTGATDGRHLASHGCKVHGFMPLRPEKDAGSLLKTLHGVNERISTENLVFGARLLADIIHRFCSEH